MNSHDSTSTEMAQLNIVDEAIRAKAESYPQGYTNRLRSYLVSFPKSRIYVVAAVSLGVIVTLVTIVLIATTGSQTKESLPNAPCDNFYKFSCQLWNEQNPRPDWITKWDVFSDLNRKSNELVLEILEEPFQHDEINGLSQAKDLYRKCVSYYSDGTNHTIKRSSMYGNPLVVGTKMGKATHPPTNEICSQLIKDRFESIVVHKYIMRKYPDIFEFEEIRTEVQAIFDNIKMVFEKADLPFFSKLANNTKVCIGFPDWILNSTAVQSKYDGFVLGKDDSFEIQLLKTTIWLIIQELMSLIQSINSAECWKYHSDISYEAETTRTAISKYNNDSILIYIPLGMLEPPFFQLHRHKTMNYGALGFIIGHELAHAYLGHDWPKSADKDLESLSECLKRQYNTFTSDDSIGLNGELTLSENLPDNLGLLASYIAYSNVSDTEASDNSTAQKLEPTGNPTNQLLWGQLKDEQMFFLSFSQMFCESDFMKQTETKMQRSDHAPGIFRVLGTLENSDEFAESWNCSNRSNNRRQNCQLHLKKTMATGI